MSAPGRSIKIKIFIQMTRPTTEKPSIKERLEQSRKECAGQSKTQPHREKAAPEL